MWKRLLLLTLVLGVVAATAAGAWLRYALWRPVPTDAIELEIAEGSSARSILGQLEDHGLLSSVLGGRVYLRVWGRGRALHYGHFSFPAQSRPVDVLEKILNGRIEMFSVTVVEGSDSETVANQFVALGVGSHDEWLHLVGDVDVLAHVAPDAPSLEGFLFPDTYRFAVGISADEVVRHLVERFVAVWREDNLNPLEPWGAPHDIVTLASLVDAETSSASERARVAGVDLNRLRRGMLLQCDPTVVYALKRRGEWRGRLLRIHWEIDDPFNTYRNPGLPPGPINSPGRAALAAALRPEETPFLYFVAQPGGGHAFSRTLAEHNRAVARLRAARR